MIVYPDPYSPTAEVSEALTTLQRAVPQLEHYMARSLPEQRDLQKLKELVREVRAASITLSLFYSNLENHHGKI